MRAVNLVGLFGGMAFTAIGLSCIAFFDCRVYEIFPVLVSKSLEIRPASFPKSPEPIVEVPFALSCCECVVSRSGVLWVICCFAVVFMISGALASRIGETPSPGRGALAVVLAFGAILLQAAASGNGVDAMQTTLVGVGALIGAIVCAYGAACFAVRNA